MRREQILCQVSLGSAPGIPKIYVYGRSFNAKSKAPSNEISGAADSCSLEVDAGKPAVHAVGTGPSMSIADESNVRIRNRHCASQTMHDCKLSCCASWAESDNGS
jgi:hypothetical protein